MESLDYWTNVSIEAHFQQLVLECQRALETGITEIDKIDDLPPIEYVNHG